MTEEGVIASLVFFVWRSNLRLLRFARSDPYYVTARSYFRLRSSLAFLRLIEKYETASSLRSSRWQKKGLAVTSRWVTARSYFRFRSSLLFPSLRGSMRLLRFARSDKVKGSLRGRSVFSEAVSFFNESRSAKRNPKVTVAPTLLASSLFHPLTQHS